MKYLLDFLHGTWLGHPLHPVLVHLPMGLWPAAFLFDLLSWLGIGGGPMLEASFWSIALGLISALLAIPAGLADWSEVGGQKAAWKFGLYHLILNSVVVVLWLVSLGIRQRLPAETSVIPTGLLALSCVATLTLAVSAYFGGRMTFDYGTFVGWMSLSKWRHIAVKSGARVPEENSK